MDWLLAVMFGLAGPPSSGDDIYYRSTQVVDQSTSLVEKDRARRQHRDHRHELRSAIPASETLSPHVGYAATAPTGTTAPSKLIAGTPLLGQDPRKPLSWWLFSTPLPKELSAEQ